MSLLAILIDPFLNSDNILCVYAYDDPYEGQNDWELTTVNMNVKVMNVM